MKKDRVILLFFIATFLNHPLVFSQVQSDSTSTYEMSLEELMNMPITVASSEALSPRESPGIVSLITAGDIAKMGARDLIDVLRTVPGFEFGVDVSGVTGIGIRGNWAHEGKVLILLDGHEMNETAYGTSQVGNHFPVDQIQRIEIIRGPGSALYGGYAELGVINIISKKAADIGGVGVATSYGQMQSDFGRSNATVMVGKEIGDLAFDAKLTTSKALRSNKTYTDFYGGTYEMADNSEMKNLHLNGGLSYKNLSVRLLYEDYELQQRDLYDEAMIEPVQMHFKTQSIDVKYGINISDKVKLTPRINYKKQNPWLANSDAALRNEEAGFYNYFDNDLTKLTGNLTLNVDFSPSAHLISGVEYYEDKGKLNGATYEFNNSNTIDFSNLSVFSQALFKTKVANITVGARYNNHEQFGSSFVPRVGVTKVVNNFHAKLLLSQAFRAPSIQNIDPNPEIKPEQTSVIEIEAGYKLNDKMLVTANLFRTRIDDPIVYFYDVDTDVEGYDNFDKTGTHGFEIEYKYQGKGVSVNVNYSYYNSAGENDIDSYTVPGKDNVLLGFAQNKFNMMGSIHLSDNFTVNPSVTFLGKRYGYTMVDENKDSVLEEFDPVVFVNLYLNYNNRFTKNLNLGVGVNNLTNNDYAYIQPYNSGHAPLPARSAEYGIKLSYKLGF
ncbi:TonB-dependent receptor plug domain-containing protein [Fulvivirga ligni]|uniref:TonB-dependent receptor plug domain-containing protein n=1 Tax=Fulvivirga ligni TaxID=2904246 RepID=UPI001F301662|nr:TonB-dependent receptor plug domain-containing protein [Fulvivirga ligni]UII19841.1 TonB-dependent receptor [Fulvivirga ligni]